MFPGLDIIGSGLFVPVNDLALNTAFTNYAASFSTYAADMKSALTDGTDSLRNIIAGADPGGVETPVSGGRPKSVCEAKYSNRCR